MGLNRAREPWLPGPVFDYAVGLARPAGTPKLCLLATAGGDQRETLRQFEAAFADQPIELSRLAQFHQLVADKTLPAGYTTDAGAGLHFEGTVLVTAISDRKNAGAYWVERNSDGTARETALEIRRLRWE